MSSVKEKLEAKQRKQQIVIDSLNQVHQDSLISDSLNQQQAKQDSLMTALKSFKDLQDLEYLDSQFLNSQPVSEVFKSGDWQEKSINAMNKLLTDMITHEAGTNVTEDYRRFQILREDLLNIHRKFQGQIHSGDQYGKYGAGRQGQLEQLQTIIEDPSLITMERFFKGANSIDRAWPSDVKRTGGGTGPVALSMEKGTYKAGDPSSDVHFAKDLTNLISNYINFPPQYKEFKHDFESATKARMVAQNQDIINLILGSHSIDEQNGQVIKVDGFVGLLERFNLTGETEWWKNTKESFGYRSNTMEILDIALRAKKQGRDYFLQAGGFYSENTGYNVSGISREMEERLSQYPEEARKQILEPLQNIVNSIYNKGIIIEKEADVLLDEYNTLATKFPTRRGLHTDSMTGFDNKNMIKAQEYKEDLTNFMDVYKYMSGGEEFDVQDALNQISLEQLNTELESLPDEERTNALEQWIINLSNQGGEAYPQ